MHMHTNKLEKKNNKKRSGNQTIILHTQIKTVLRSDI